MESVSLDAQVAAVGAAGNTTSASAAQNTLLATLVTSIAWTADGKGIVAVFVPDDRKPEPKKPEIASGPRVTEWLDSVKSPQRNFASLLEDPFEMDLLEYYVTGQLAVVDVKAKTVRKIGAPSMIESFSPSPDAQFFRVVTMHRPFSNVVQYTSFGTDDAIWDGDGKMAAVIQRRSLREGPDSTQAGAGFVLGGAAGGPSGKRFLGWMPSGPGMFYVAGEQRDTSGEAARGRGGRGGGGAAEGPDRIVQWLPPFGPADTKVLYQADGPISTVLFSEDAKSVFIGTTAASVGTLYEVDLSRPDIRHTIVQQRAYTPAFSSGRGGRGGGGAASPNGLGLPVPDDSLVFYGSAGAMLSKPGASGGQVAVISSDSAVFLTGTQHFVNYLQNAPRMFVDKVDIKSEQRARVYYGPTDAAETLEGWLDDDLSRVIVSHSTPTTVTDSYVRDLKAGQSTRLTSNRDYTPEFTSAIRKRIMVTRADGFKFVVHLTLPPDYKAGTRLPAMFWFYPGEYTEQANYDRNKLRTENVNLFPPANPREIEYLEVLGYAVANFDPPIVGAPGRMNDNYVTDLVANLSAVIDELDRLGYIDRTRLGIGGHSYGAFSTMNALAHTPYFKAGIAGDGMYNRSLTPNQFQYEMRDFWSGQKTYEEMSPFFYADKIQGAVLMYHSIEDQNVGTDPISSVRMMQALRANGKTAALYMYPYEDHGPATVETDLDQWGRWTAWLDLYVKHANEPKVIVP